MRIRWENSSTYKIHYGSYDNTLLRSWSKSSITSRNLHKWHILNLPCCMIRFTQGWDWSGYQVTSNQLLSATLRCKPVNIPCLLLYNHLHLLAITPPVYLFILWFLYKNWNFSHEKNLVDHLECFYMRIWDWSSRMTTKSLKERESLSYFLYSKLHSSPYIMQHF